MTIEIDMRQLHKEPHPLRATPSESLPNSNVSDEVGNRRTFKLVLEGGLTTPTYKEEIYDNSISYD